MTIQCKVVPSAASGVEPFLGVLAAVPRQGETVGFYGVGGGLITETVEQVQYIVGSHTPTLLLTSA